MRSNAFRRLVAVLACALMGAVALPLYAQDPLPRQGVPDRHRAVEVDSEPLLQLLRFIPVEDAPMPAVFRNTAENVLTDASSSLAPFWEKLSRMDSPVRIVHIGDSHVRGHVFPYEVRQCLEADFGGDAVEHIPVSYQTSGVARETGENGLVYHIIGVNGATCASFSTPERIDEVVALQPDLVILSFGTNEAHGRSYSPSEHGAAMHRLTEAIRQSCPGVVFLFTTPPGAYKRMGRKGYAINPNTQQVSDVVLAFARENGMAAWDMYRVAGGKARACLNWSAANLFQRDKIHFTHDGYKLQGLLFHEAFIKAYNKYVADRLE